MFRFVSAALLGMVAFATAPAMSEEAEVTREGLNRRFSELMLENDRLMSENDRLMAEFDAVLDEHIRLMAEFKK